MIPKKSVFADITERHPKERGVVEVETLTLAQQALNLQKKTTGDDWHLTQFLLFFMLLLLN